MYDRKCMYTALLYSSTLEKGEVRLIAYEAKMPDPTKINQT